MEARKTNTDINANIKKEKFGNFLREHYSTHRVDTKFFAQKFVYTKIVFREERVFTLCFRLAVD